MRFPWQCKQLSAGWLYLHCIVVDDNINLLAIFKSFVSNQTCNPQNTED